MKTVYKYPVGELQLPKDAKVLTAGQQNGDMFIWAEIDTDQILEHRTFQVFGTGHPIPKESCYIATTFDGPFVWHIYEVV